MTLVFKRFSKYPRFRYRFKFLDSREPAPTLAFGNICPFYLYLFIFIYSIESAYMCAPFEKLVQCLYPFIVLKTYGYNGQFWL
jgi:hypothetical protein